MAELIVTDVHVSHGQTHILKGVSLNLKPGELVALIGPNGAGKTTLLRAAMGMTPISAGSVTWNGNDPRRLSATKRARLIAYLPQVRPLAWPLKVEDVVGLGRFAYGAPLSRPSGVDQAAIAAALEACRLHPLKSRDTSSLSGGEVSRVHVARALAAQTPLLIADEPTAALDPLHAHETMAILKDFCAKGGGAIVTLHDLSLAARYADKIVLIYTGQVLAQGSPQEVLTPDLLAKAYRVRAHLLHESVIIGGPID